MQVLIDNPVQSTFIFISIFFAALLISARIKKPGQFFPISQTQELKGLAILFVVISHIGYFLAADNRFLFPFSIMAGVGVNLFLFLSGLGLTASALKKKLSIFGFYRKNLLKLFTPFWLSLILFLLLDFFVLKIVYPWQFIEKAFLGFFPSADLYRDLNSPLWYFTLILFYYLVFPLFFNKKFPWLSAAAIYAASYFILRQNIDCISWVAPFYRSHNMAFPLGILAGWVFYGSPFQYKTNGFYIRLKNAMSRAADALGRSKKYLLGAGHCVLIISLIAAACYLAYYFSGGEDTIKGQMINIVTMSAVLCLFLIKKIEFKLLQIFGKYSYEIYLLHWPVLYRYDLFYKYLPSWLATVFYLIFFVGIALALKKISEAILTGIDKMTHSRP
ncbi:MAG: acyltransferase family protein [Candidatus Paceibacterota bacterium]|jgi:peptidoglycan/LPS O-acetylase OafA/YrhL